MQSTSITHLIRLIEGRAECIEFVVLFPKKTTSTVAKAVECMLWIAIQVTYNAIIFKEFHQSV